MSTYTMNLSPVAGTNTATSDQAGKALFLGNGDSMVAQIGTAFGANSKITAINFFVSTTAKAAGVGSQFQRITTGAIAKVTSVTYPSPPTQSSITLASVNSPGDRQSITITDAEGTPNNDQHVWFTIEITDGTGKVWTLDPEVVNTGGNDPRRGFATPTSSDTTQTLGATASPMPQVVTRSPYAPARSPTP